MDIRWKQRFSKYRKALQVLSDAVRLAGERPLSALEEQGVSRPSKFTHELAWNVLKDCLERQGVSGIVGSRGPFARRFKTV